MSASAGKCVCKDRTYYKDCYDEITEDAKKHHGKPEDKCITKQKRTKEVICEKCKEALKAQRKAAREAAREQERGQTSGRTSTSRKGTIGHLLDDSPPPRLSSSSKAATGERRRRPVDSSTSSSASPRPSAKKVQITASSFRSDTYNPARPLLVHGPLAPDPSSAPRLRREALESDEERQDDEQQRQELRWREDQNARARERERERLADLEDARRRQQPLTYHPTQPAAYYPGAPAPAPAYYYPAAPARSSYQAPAPPSYHQTVGQPSYRAIAPIPSPYESQPPPAYRAIAPIPSPYDAQPSQQELEGQRPAVPPPQPAPGTQRSRRLEYTPGVLEPGARNLSGTPGQRAAEQYRKFKKG